MIFYYFPSLWFKYFPTTHLTELPMLFPTFRHRSVAKML